ncbi:hypothetical protein [Burkholderia stagnalis]|uniref:hypothetical protein n=1 Tax=Burkholderia stagnalis TaxID=1503054 RepID=UPI000F8041BC|nr:hypothetical protein [Burkholderia stagnalis]
MPNGQLPARDQAAHHAFMQHPGHGKGNVANPAKVRIYRSEGENVRELRAGMRENAKGDENMRGACTARITRGSAWATCDYRAVYRKSARHADKSRCFSGMACRNRTARRRDSANRPASRRPKNKTVRWPFGHAHRQSARER